jgi:uncharacterized protein YjbJ (UPF0337 family)
MSDNQADKAKGRVKDTAGSFTGTQFVMSDGQAEQTRRAVLEDQGENLVDTLPGRGSE